MFVFRIFILLLFVVFYTETSYAAESLVVAEDMSLTAGEYMYDELLVKSGVTLTLLGDPLSSSTFKGVRIEAQNITIEEGAHISADAQGYNRQQGPGASVEYGTGGSYGGLSVGIDVGTTYGSSIDPVDLGSGGGYSPGGGAIMLHVSETLLVDGSISSDGAVTGSGGSINISTNQFTGSGVISAQGGQYTTSSSYGHPGGGGRVFIEFQDNQYTGSVTVQGGKKSQGRGYAQSGSAALYDQTTNTLMPQQRFDFNGQYGPFTYQVVVASGTAVFLQDSAQLDVVSIELQGESSLDVSSTSVIRADHMVLSDNARMIYRSPIPLSVHDLELNDNAILEGNRLVRLQIEADTLSLDEGAQLHVDQMGYSLSVVGPGTPEIGTYAGGSHGGKARGSYSKPIYGSETEPIDFGSTGDFYEEGGGALYLTVSGTLRNDGRISAEGGVTASGGSILINANVFEGSGLVTVDGGKFGGHSRYVGAGAGGRVAVYFGNASQWTGSTTALGGKHAYSAGSPLRYAGDGTVIFQQNEQIDPLLLQYMPILQMHHDEDYLPMNIEAFVARSSLWDQGAMPDRLIKAEDGNDPVTLADLSGTGSEDWYLQFNDSTEAATMDPAAAHSEYDALVDSGEAETTVYVHKMEDSFVDDAGAIQEYTVLQYWYFYAMNNWKEAMEDQEGDGFNNHEGDWESVFVFLDTNTEEPKYVAYSAHHNDGDPSNPFQYDSVRRGWSSNDIVLDNGQIVSFVALGSHANYPNMGNNGIHTVPDFAEDNEDLVSDTGEVLSVDTWSVAEQISSTSPNWIIDYEGKWGTDQLSLGHDGPLGPLRSNVGGTIRFLNPVEWAGIDKIYEQVVSEPTKYMTFDTQATTFFFAEDLLIGTTVSVDLHEEPVTFGVNVEDVNFMPYFYDIESNLENDTFQTDIMFLYDEELVALLGIEEKYLGVFYFNEDTNEWEYVDTAVDVINRTATFSTAHFSRYALGERPSEWVEVFDMKVKENWGGYHPQKGEYTLQMGLQNKGTTTFSGTFRVVIVDIEKNGVGIENEDGVTSEGYSYIIKTVEGFGVNEDVYIDIEFSSPMFDSNTSNTEEKFIQKHFDIEVVVERDLREAS